MSDELKAELDKVSLRQALLDAEIANARARDLTERLLELSRELTAVRGQLAELQAQHHALVAQVDAQRRSRAYRLTEQWWQLRRAVSG